jgi:hypothetical protein
MLPCSACPFPPRPCSPAAGKSGLGWARGKGAQEQEAATQNLQTLVCPHRIVQLALHWHSVVMKLIKLTGMQAHNVHTHMRTTCTHMHRRTHLHTRTDTHAHAHTHTYTHEHTSLSSTLAHTRAHTHTCTHSSYSTQAARKAGTRMQQQLWLTPLRGGGCWYYYKLKILVFFSVK